MLRRCFRPRRASCSPVASSTWRPARCTRIGRSCSTGPDRGRRPRGRRARGSDGRPVGSYRPAGADRLPRAPDRGARRRSGLRLARRSHLRAGGAHRGAERPRHGPRRGDHGPRRGHVPRVRRPRAPGGDRRGSPARPTDDVRRRVHHVPRRRRRHHGVAGRVPVPDNLRVGVSVGPEQVRSNVRRIFDAGADIIKVIATGAVLTSGTNPASPSSPRTRSHAAVEEAGAQLPRRRARARRGGRQPRSAPASARSSTAA